MGRADDRTPRARRDAAADLCGIDLILECERPPKPAPPRSQTMEQERLAALPLHRRPRPKPRRLGAHLRTVAPKPARRPLMDGGLFIAEATRTPLSAHLVRWNVMTIAKQPRLRARIESKLN
jgi:hypothetical protein